jgi:hypothetical protein
MFKLISQIWNAATGRLSTKETKFHTFNEAKYDAENSNHGHSFKVRDPNGQVVLSGKTEEKSTYA